MKASENHFPQTVFAGQSAKPTPTISLLAGDQFIYFNKAAGRFKAVDYAGVETNLVADIVTGVTSLSSITGDITLSTGPGIAVNIVGQDIEIENTLTSLIGLSDFPNTYTGQAGKFVAVKTDETGVIFIPIPAPGPTELSALTDVDVTSTPPTDGQALAWNETASKWIPETITSGSVSQWTTAGTSIYYDTGNVGLGTMTPTETLDVVGNVKFSGTLKPNNDAGTAGQVLTSAGDTVVPTWETLQKSNILAQGVFTVDETTNAITIRNGFNISSIIRIATGGYQVTMTEAAPDIYYGINGLARQYDDASANAVVICLDKVSSFPTTTVFTLHTAATAVDVEVDVLYCAFQVYDPSRIGVGGGGGGGGSSLTLVASNSGNTLDGWTQFSGSWATDGTIITGSNNGIQNGKLQLNASTQGPNCVMEAEFYFPTTGDQSSYYDQKMGFVFFDGTSANGGIAIRLVTNAQSPQKIDIEYDNSSAIATLKNSAWGLVNTWTKLRVEFICGAAIIYVNDILVASRLAIVYTNVISVAILVGNSVASIRNIKVYSYSYLTS